MPIVALIGLAPVLTGRQNLTRRQVAPAPGALPCATDIVLGRAEQIAQALRIFAGSAADFAHSIIEHVAATFAKAGDALKRLAVKLRAQIDYDLSDQSISITFGVSGTSDTRHFPCAPTCATSSIAWLRKHSDAPHSFRRACQHLLRRTRPELSASGSSVRDCKSQSVPRPTARPQH